MSLRLARSEPGARSTTTFLLLASATLGACAARPVRDPGLVLAAPLAEELEVEEDDVFAVESVLYRQDDGGGNPFVDEDATIFESILLVRDQLGERNAVTYRFLGDVISAASYDEFKDLAVSSGASGYNPGRLGLAVGWEHERGTWLFGVEGNFAQEYAYRSGGIALRAAKSLNENNTRLALSLENFFDLVRVIRFDGAYDGDFDRDTWTGELTVTQLLTPESLVDVSLHHTDQQGFLATSFNSVMAGGVELPEVTPDTRARDSLTARYKHSVLGDDAVEAGYRYYEDDWGIEGHTLELRYFRSLPETDVLLEPHYRYYDQSGADFFGVTFDAPAELQTSDPDLGSFTGHLFGLLLRLPGTSVLGVQGDWSVGFDFYDRSDGLDLYWLSFGLRRRF